MRGVNLRGMLFWRVWHTWKISTDIVCWDDRALPWNDCMQLMQRHCRFFRQSHSWLLNICRY